MFGALIAYRYWVLGPLAFLEGPLLAFACGAAASFGYVNPFIAYGILVLGDLAPDLIYYGIGYWGAGRALNTRFGSRFVSIRDNLQSLGDAWQNHGLLMMATSKAAYGISAPFIVSAGLVRLPFFTFVRYSISVSVVMMGLLIAAGYFFADSYIKARDFLHNAEIVFGLAGIALFIGIFFLMKYFRGQLSGYGLYDRKNKGVEAAGS